MTLRARATANLDFRRPPRVGQNCRAMDVESRDSVSLKPVELDELGQLLHAAGLPISDEELDVQVEQFPLATVASQDGEVLAFLLGSLERIGGTPAILWGLGTARRGRNAPAALRAITAELSRRAGISFPDEDVLVSGRIAQPAGYTLLGAYSSVCPRPGYTPTGEDRAWGRRLAKRFGCAAHFDDRTFQVAVGGRKRRALPIFDAAAMKGTGGAKIVSLVGNPDPCRGQAMIAFGWAVAEQLAACVRTAAC